MEPLVDHEPVSGPRFLRKVEGALVALSAICILGIGALITVSIIGRAVFAWSVPDSIIFVRELMVGAVILPLAFVTAERAHIMVEVFTDHMPEKIQPWLNLMASCIGFLAILPILYGGWYELQGVVEDEAYFFGDLELPEWPARTAFVIGYVFFVLRLAVMCCSDALSILHPKKTISPSANDQE